MEQSRKITSILSSNDITLAGSITKSSSGQSYFVPISIERTSDGHYRPGGRKLRELREMLAGESIFVEFLKFDPAEDEFEDQIRTTLLVAFPKRLRNVYADINRRDVRVFLDLKDQGDESILHDSRGIIDRLADLHGLKISEVTSLHSQNVATPFEILSIVRRLAPIPAQRLCHEIESKGFAIPSPDWMARRLDSLRRSELLIRTKREDYVLTLEGLQRLGSRKDRHSPDISRLLALVGRGE